jgi:hypothetical protein
MLFSATFAERSDPGEQCFLSPLAGTARDQPGRASMRVLRERASLCLAATSVVPERVIGTPRRFR